MRGPESECSQRLGLRQCSQAPLACSPGKGERSGFEGVKGMKKTRVMALLERAEASGVLEGEMEIELYVGGGQNAASRELVEYPINGR
jgi:hypothetical protein